MKIAFVTRGFTGSILPLMKQMISDNHHVDLYIICNRSQLDDIEAFDCDYQANRVGLNQVDEHCWKEAYEYIGGKSGRLYCLRLQRPFESVPIIGKLKGYINRTLLNKAARFINKQNYDMINIVCGYYSSEYLPLIEKLDLKPVISLHEVCNHFNPDYVNVSPLLKVIFEQQLDIILYSDNTYRDMLNYDDVHKDKLHRINFGCFTSYLSVKNDSNLVLPSNYILFFGTLKEYKGLSVLYDAVVKYNALPSGIKCVVAGAGHDDAFEKMKEDDRFVCIQKRLTNGELVRLIRDSLLVVCPYLTVSQSGIPQTVFVFDKPIIASRLGGFTEILNDSNAVLFEAGNPGGLASGIQKLLSDNVTYRSVVDGIKDFDNPHSTYSWTYIANQYYGLISSIK